MHMTKLDENCKEHLHEALSSEDPLDKNYHIRQVLQISGETDLPDELAKLSLPSEEHE
jgi:hypothetical protein